MKEVFISYARDDQVLAARLAALLEADGWEVWWDPRLYAGEAYDEEIQRHLQDADAVVVLWSTSSASSRWVKAEADVGMSRNVLVPVLLEDVDVPLPFHRLQTADLTGWSGNAAIRG